MFDTWLSAENVPAISGTAALAMLFPQMAPEERLALCKDIEKHGLREPVIVMPNGELLDGRHRFQAWQAVSTEPIPTLVFVGSDGAASEADAFRFVVGKNGSRRHLSATQRAMVAARSREFCRLSQSSRAQANSVSKRYVEYADELLASQRHGLIKDVDNGKLTIKTAAERSRLPVRVPAQAPVEEAEQAGGGLDEPAAKPARAGNVIELKHATSTYMHDDLPEPEIDPEDPDDPGYTVEVIGGEPDVAESNTNEKAVCPLTFEEVKAIIESLSDAVFELTAAWISNQRLSRASERLT
jgi:ParB-like chromosome segregation protein Spo0J